MILSFVSFLFHAGWRPSRQFSSARQSIAEGIIRVSMDIVMTFVRWRLQKQETQLSLTNRATRLAILTFEKYRDPETGVMGH